MKILLSAYSCEPDHGSEPGAGFSLLQAASSLGEVWVLTRGNNVDSIEEALQRDGSAHPVHVIGVDGPAWTLTVKRRLKAVRPYYFVWQRAASRRAQELDRMVGGFDVVHHATMSAYWLPVGVVALARPLVIGPVSGGEFTPRPMWRYLGVRGLLHDVVRYASAMAMAVPTRSRWRSADVVIAQNRETLGLVERRLIGRNAPVRCQSHGVSPTVDAVPVVTGRRREVLFVGRLMTWKGILLALEAFAHADLRGVRFVVIGDGPDRGLIERHVARLGLTERVEIAGSMERADVLDRMRHASCLLFPSFHDSAGFVVSEALSLGLPVVCLDHGGPGELVRSWPDVPAVAVPTGRPAETVARLARAIERFVDEPAPIPDGVVPTTKPLHAALAESYSLARDRWTPR
jgi:glycosyltransferase involved in cell wall biosynthesis